MSKKKLKKNVKIDYALISFLIIVLIVQLIIGVSRIYKISDGTLIIDLISAGEYQKSAKLLRLFDVNNQEQIEKTIKLEQTTILNSYIENKSSFSDTLSEFLLVRELCETDELSNEYINCEENILKLISYEEDSIYENYVTGNANYDETRRKFDEIEILCSENSVRNYNESYSVLSNKIDSIHEVRLFIENTDSSRYTKASDFSNAINVYSTVSEDDKFYYTKVEDLQEQMMVSYIKFCSESIGSNLDYEDLGLYNTFYNDCEISKYRDECVKEKNGAIKSYVNNLDAKNLNTYHDYLELHDFINETLDEGIKKSIQSKEKQILKNYYSDLVSNHYYIIVDSQGYSALDIAKIINDHEGKEEIVISDLISQAKKYEKENLINLINKHRKDSKKSEIKEDKNCNLWCQDVMNNTVPDKNGSSDAFKKKYDDFISERGYKYLKGSYTWWDGGEGYTCATAKEWIDGNENYLIGDSSIGEYIHIGVSISYEESENAFRWVVCLEYDNY